MFYCKYFFVIIFLFFYCKYFFIKFILQICDSNIKMSNIYAQYAEATHDSYIWRNSNIYRYLKKCFERDHSSS